MEADWQELQRLPLPSGRAPLNGDVHGYGPTPNIGALAFDTQEELLWVGDYSGHLTSYTGIQLERYTAFDAHPEHEGQVRQIICNARGVVSLSSRSVHCAIRRGLAQWHTEHPAMQRLCCMVSIGRGNVLLVAGAQDRMLKLDIARGTILEIVPSSAGYVMMKQARYICAATASGTVDFLDPTTLQVMKTWLAHTASVNDMAVSATNTLITCGRSLRQNGPAMLESLAKVYDMKNLQQLPPVPFPAAAAFVEIHPRLSSTCVLGAQNGQLQIVDLVNPNTSNLVVLGIFVTHFLIAPSGNLWIVADQDNVLHLWGSLSKAATFNDSAQLSEYADPVQSVPRLGIDDEIPLNTIGMPYYRERLLSAWGNEQAWEVGCLPQRIAPEIERYLRPGLGFGQCAQNPHAGTKRRNQASRARLTDTSSSSFPSHKLLSQKIKESLNNDGEGKELAKTVENLASLSFNGATRCEVPWYYMNVKIKYGKYGVADFDFRAYNDTVYSGLETDISNTFLNSLLQLLRLTPAIRNHALHHVASRCLTEDCLLCELGFLCDMLEKARGQVCQPANFLKVFAGSAKAASLALTRDLPGQTRLGPRLSHGMRMLLSHLADDSASMDQPEYRIDRIFGVEAHKALRCMNCQCESFQASPCMSVDMIYPESLPAYRTRIPAPRFSDVLKLSLTAPSQSKGYCRSCRKYPIQSTRRAIMALPSVLLLDTALHRDTSTISDQQYYATNGWLPDEILITTHPSGEIIVHEGDATHHHLHDPNAQHYDLVGLVADVTSIQGQKSHLVSFINTSISERVAANDVGEPNAWHLFNDFLVRPVSQAEALKCDPTWKTPIILAYQSRTYRHVIDDSWRENLDISCVYHDGSLNYTQNPLLGCPLEPSLDTPESGFPLAIDAEFVSLEQEEIEIKIDGSVELIRPVRQGTGRLSALRGRGPDQGVPFIDDYIKISEPIVDHLTQYSGLSAGDLDPQRSSHALVSLKVAYKKLWLLSNLGCIFVGHGLASDFRTINIYIPPSQIIDTVTLFRPENEKRRLSLRFLAWYFLDEEIQTGNHDSIVDARTALKLWRCHEHFVQQGLLDQRLADIYRDGPNTAFKPPAEFEAQGGKLGRPAARRKIPGKNDHHNNTNNNNHVNNDNNSNSNVDNPPYTPRRTKYPTSSTVGTDSACTTPTGRMTPDMAYLTGVAGPSGAFSDFGNAAVTPSAKTNSKIRSQPSTYFDSPSRSR